MSALSEFCLGTMRGRSQLRRYRRRFNYLEEAKAIFAKTCGFCGNPVMDDELDTQLVAPHESLRVVLLRRADNFEEQAGIAKAARRKLRARRGHPPGRLCIYCYTRFAHGRAAAEALDRGVESAKAVVVGPVWIHAARVGS